MRKQTKQLRRSLAALVLALAVLATAVPAGAQPQAWDGGWLSGGIAQVANWWTALWNGTAGRAGAASEALPRLDPNGDDEPLDSPNDSMSSTETENPGGGTEAAPHIDPNG